MSAIAECKVDFLAASSDEIKAYLCSHHINLTVDETKSIQSMLKRPPSMAELVLWSIQGSEHCSYKSSRCYLKQLVTEGPEVILGAKEDAGVIEIARDANGQSYALVVSHESHNHPSQIVPFEGAATGVGGNVRDVCCMGAEVIAQVDGLRFGAYSRPKTHWIKNEVVRGISSYGNALGIPNLTGDVYYHSGFNDNCLVTVTTFGIVKTDDIIHSYAPLNAQGYQLILVGKPTDESGFGGASFASDDLNENDQAKNRGAVQEPNAFLGRVLIQAHTALFEKIKKMGVVDQVGFKDLGAGGIACASVELADTAGYGAVIDLDQVKTAYPNIPDHVILCAETQERYMWVAPPDLTPMILAHYNEVFALPEISVGACARVIGHIVADEQYQVLSKGQSIVKAKACDITRGIQYQRPWTPRSRPNLVPLVPKDLDLKQVLLDISTHENMRADQHISDCYDKQVQGRTICERTYGQAGVMAPFNHVDYPQEIRDTMISVAGACNPYYGEIDAYWGSIYAVLESIQLLIAKGARPLALTDCLCFGNPEKPEAMGEFKQAIDGLVDVCRHLNVWPQLGESLPIVAGNVSFYNESNDQAIPASAMITAMGIQKTHPLRPGFKQPGSAVLRIGVVPTHLGGSLFANQHGLVSTCLPECDLELVGPMYAAILELIEQGHLLSCQSIFRSGLWGALLLLQIQGDMGFKSCPWPGNMMLNLLAEGPGFVVEVHADAKDMVIDHLKAKHIPSLVIGYTQASKHCDISDVRIDLPTLQQAHHSTFWEKSS